MRKIIAASLKSVILFTIICGGIYTLAVTAVGQLLFSQQANGSIITAQIGTEKQIIGSKLIGQNFKGENYLHGRPTAVSQLSPVGIEQEKRIADRVAKEYKTAVPIELVTASGSGLDPEISLEAAEFQVERIALARGMKNSQVRAIINQNIIGYELGPITTKRVTVLGVNQMLDAL